MICQATVGVKVVEAGNRVALVEMVALVVLVALEAAAAEMEKMVVVVKVWAEVVAMAVRVVQAVWGPTVVTVE